MRKLRAAALILFLLLLLGGCGSSAGEIIRYDVPTGVSLLDPQFATDTTARMIISNTFEGLYRQLPDGEVVPRLAESSEVSGDGLVWTFHLRRDAVWNASGSRSAFHEAPVTAHDFAFALSRMFDPAAFSPFAGEFSSVKNASLILSGAAPQSSLGVRALDDYTLEVTLVRQDSRLPELLSASYAMPCSREFFESTRARYGFDIGSLPCNGPFYLYNWNNDRVISLRRNRHYLDDQPVVARGVDLYTPGAADGAEPAARFLAGETDACKVSFSDLPAVEDTGGQVTSFEDTVWVLLLNGHKEPLANTNIRQAVAYSVNRSLFEGRLPGNLRAADTLVPPAILWQGETFRARAGEKGPLVSSPDLAKRCYVAGLEDLGLSALPLGELLVCEGNNQRALAGYVQQGLQRSLGLFAGLNVLPQEEALERVREGDFDAAIVPLSAAYSSPDALLSLFRSGSGQNWAGYSNADFDALLDSASPLSGVELFDAYRQAETLLLEDGAVIPLYFETSYYASGKGVTGIGFSPFLTGVSFQSSDRE